jgi:hypothetical protein
MTLREVDDSLAAWNARLGTVAQNLMDLQAQPTYQQLTGTGGLPKAHVTGTTAGRVEPALAAMATLFQYFGCLNQTVSRATSLRHNLPALFPGEQRVREIEDLICGKSIRLPAAELPLEQRGLLSTAENAECVSPAELLAAMVKSFETARDAVMAVDAAWQKLGSALKGVDSEIAALRGRAGNLRVAEPAGLATAAAALSNLRAGIQVDPLGTSASLDTEIRPLLAGVKAELEACEQIRRQIEEGFAAARTLLQKLQELHCGARLAATEARAKVTGCESLPEPQPDDTIRALAEWLGRLAKKRDEGAVEPIAAGLRSWNRAAEDCVSKEHAALAANRAPVETRNELRGRLDALKAKARAYGVSEEGILTELAQQAQALLYTRPTPLDQAAAAVVRYEQTLNGRNAGPPSGPHPEGIDRR